MIYFVLYTSVEREEVYSLHDYMHICIVADCLGSVSVSIVEQTTCDEMDQALDSTASGPWGGGGGRGGQRKGAAAAGQGDRGQAKNKIKTGLSYSALWLVGKYLFYI